MFSATIEFSMPRIASSSSRNTTSKWAFVVNDRAIDDLERSAGFMNAASGAVTGISTDGAVGDGDGMGEATDATAIGPSRIPTDRTTGDRGKTIGSSKPDSTALGSGPSFD